MRLGRSIHQRRQGYKRDPTPERVLPSLVPLSDVGATFGSPDGGLKASPTFASTVGVYPTRIGKSSVRLATSRSGAGMSGGRTWPWRFSQTTGTPARRAPTMSGIGQSPT